MGRGEHVFTTDQRISYEAMSVAFAVYQLVDNKVVALLVSDGLCELVGKKREELILHYNTDMFQNVHPDDVEMLAQIGYRFAREEDDYDVIYRTKLWGREEYRLLHTVGKFQTVGAGVRVAFLVYTDVTELKNHKLNQLQEVNTPKVNFFNENMGPMVVVAREDLRLLYYNQAVCRMIPPKTNYDSGITFQQFFFPDYPEGITELLNGVNAGTKTIEEPYTKREIEASVITTYYNKERAYVIYFYEIAMEMTDREAETTLRHRRMAFHNTIFCGKQDGFSYSENGYQDFRIWNLSKNKLVYYVEQGEMKSPHKKENSYDYYISNLKEQSREIGDLDFFQHCTRKQLLTRFATGSYPRTKILNLNTFHGAMYVSLELIMMQSPDTEDIYLKIWEENITDKEIIRILATKAIEQEYDFMAYLDVLADRGWIVYGRTSGIRDKRKCIKMSDTSQSRSFLNKMEELMDDRFETMDELMDFVQKHQDETNNYERIRQLEDGKIKRLFVQQVGSHSNILYIRSTDVTQILLEKIQREQELETAKNMALESNKYLKETVLNEREKVEDIMVQTVLAVSKALEAKDPYTCEHSERVAKYAAKIAGKLNWNPKRIKDIYNISLVHDIGKIGIPDSLLMKPTSLTREEAELIKDHVVIGSNILKDFTAIEHIYEGILYHHERYDGCGYVFGLQGEHIPIEARVIGIADAVDAMYSTRPYREKQDVDYILSELKRGSGKQFDPVLVEIMLELIQGGMLENEEEKVKEYGKKKEFFGIGKECI